MSRSAFGAVSLSCAILPPMDTPQPLITRFAPSPTGYLHLGHLVNAIYVWGIADAFGGQVILRLEDHDRGRCRPEYEAAILDDLEWLGLKPEQGPLESFRAGPTIFRQSDKGEQYNDVLQTLLAQERVYTCTCSRKTVLKRTGPQAGELHYDGHCRVRGYRPELEGGTRLILAPETICFRDLRLGPQTQQPAAQCGDLLLLDRHKNWTYHFAVAVDDWQQGVNCIIRGEDLLDSTGRQFQLARMLGRSREPMVLHHPLISDDGGRKLSKRDFDKGLRDYRAEGWSPEAVLGEAAWRVGLLAEPAPLDATCLGGLFSREALAGAFQEA